MKGHSNFHHGVGRARRVLTFAPKSHEQTALIPPQVV
jgi:hypothetical protein